MGIHMMVTQASLSLQNMKQVTHLVALVIVTLTSLYELAQLMHIRHIAMLHHGAKHDTCDTLSTSMFQVLQMLKAAHKLLHPLSFLSI